MELAEDLGIPLNLKPPKESYWRGWGDECTNAKPIIATWTFTVLDIYGRPTTLSYDLTEGRAPLITGLDVKKYSDTCNLSDPPFVKIKRPSDNAPRYFYTYLVEGDDRLRLELVPHRKSTVKTLLGKVQNLSIEKPLHLAKKIHRYTHATADEMIRICQKAGIMNEKLKKALEKVAEACESCISTGRP